VRYVVSLLFASLCYVLSTRLMFFNTLCMFVFCFVYSVFFRIVLCIVSPVVYIAVSFLFLYNFTDHLPPSGKPNAVNKCHTILMMVKMMIMMMKSLTSRDEIFIVEQKGIWCVLLGHICL